jgi:alpha-L-fucosidase 2
MLLQSQEHFTGPAAPTQDRYIIDLLPALPSAWPDGSASGLCARGGLVVDIAWKGGKLDKAILHSRSGGATKVRYAGREVDVKLDAGQSVVLNGALNVIGVPPGK